MKPDSITMTNYDKAVLAQKNAKELTDAAVLEIMDQMKTLLQQLTTLGVRLYDHYGNYYIASFDFNCDNEPICVLED